MKEKVERKRTEKSEAKTIACPRRRERVGTITKAAGFLSKRSCFRREGNGNSIQGSAAFGHQFCGIKNLLGHLLVDIWDFNEFLEGRLLDTLEATKGAQ